MDFLALALVLPQLPNTRDSHSHSCSCYIEIAVCLEIFRIHDIGHWIRLPVVHNPVADPAIIRNPASLACDHGSSASSSTGEPEDRENKQSRYDIAHSCEEIAALG
jgi:hypothetical protein